MAERCFVPHTGCTVASGDCFRLSRCLDRCKTKAVRNDGAKIAALERRVLDLETKLTSVAAFNGGVS